MATVEPRKRKGINQWLANDRPREQEKQNELEAADAAERSAAPGHFTTAVADRMTAELVAGSRGLVRG